MRTNFCESVYVGRRANVRRGADRYFYNMKYDYKVSAISAVALSVIVTAIPAMCGGFDGPEGLGGAVGLFICLLVVNLFLFIRETFRERRREYRRGRSFARTMEARREYEEYRGWRN